MKASSSRNDVALGQVEAVVVLRAVQNAVPPSPTGTCELDCVKHVQSSTHLETLLALCLLKKTLLFSSEMLLLPMLKCSVFHPTRRSSLISCPSSRQRQIASDGRGTDPQAPATKVGGCQTRVSEIYGAQRNTIIISVLPFE